MRFNSIYGRAQSTVLLQLAKLRAFGIIKSRRDGKKIYYSITEPRVKKITQVLGIGIMLNSRCMHENRDTRFWLPKTQAG